MKKIWHKNSSGVKGNFGPFISCQSSKCCNSANFWATKMLFTKKLVRISPEIDWYSHQWPQDGKMWYMTAVLVKIHFFLIVPSASPLCTVAAHSLAELHFYIDLLPQSSIFWSLHYRTNRASMFNFFVFVQYLNKKAFTVLVSRNPNLLDWKGWFVVGVYVLCWKTLIE